MHRDRMDERFIEAARLLADNPADADIAICGTVAMQIHGYGGTTSNIDIIANWPIRMGPAVEFANIGTTISVGPIEAHVLYHAPSSKLYSLLGAALDAADATGRIAGWPAPVVPLEHVAAMKFVAGRDRDRPGLNWLLEAGRVDVEKASEIVAKHFGWFAKQSFDETVTRSRARSIARRVLATRIVDSFARMSDDARDGAREARIAAAEAELEISLG